MHKLTEEMKQMYLGDPEMLELRRMCLYEYLERRIKEFNVDHLMKESFDELDKLWDVARSYWFFPDNSDMDKLLDEIYVKNKDN